MTLHQISVFVENQPGKLQQLTEVLASNKINMRALSLAEAADYGIARIIVDDPAAASDLLKAEGYVHTITQVLGVAIPDEPGGLNRVLQMLAEGGVNVEYMYAFLGSRSTTHAYMIFHVQDVEAASQLLTRGGIACMTHDELTQML